MPLSAQQKKKILDHNYHRINDTLYAGEREVSNLEYRNFLASFPLSERPKYNIDSLLWLKVTHGKSANEPFTRNYHWHPAFDTYPVVNIPHHHALQYCEWLTLQYANKKKKSIWIFTLPTLEEWMLLANTDPETHLPHGLGNGQNHEGCYIINVNPEGQYASDGAYYTVGDRRKYLLDEDYYKPTKFGLYHIIGNVAEMTTVDGTQKGGSWADDPEICYTHNAQHYPTPDPRVGFRVVMKARKNAK
jgi:formylglycine-generating enzyme required for sulfatase activity